MKLFDSGRPFTNKKIYDSGDKTKAELMKIYNVSNTQMKRIIKKN
jgi:hypothetical protein